MAPRVNDTPSLNLYTNVYRLRDGVFVVFVASTIPAIRIIDIGRGGS